MSVFLPEGSLAPDFIRETVAGKNFFPEGDKEEALP